MRGLRARFQPEAAVGATTKADQFDTGAMTHTFSDLLVVRVDPPDEEAASVTLSSGEGEVTAFCHPCSLVVGQRIRNRLTVLDVRKLQSPYGDDWPQDERESLAQDRMIRQGHYEYVGTGKVVDADRGLVAVQGFLIEFGDVPAVDYVEFDILRLDCEG